MSGRKSQALENNKSLFLASLVPDTDILKISIEIGLDSDEINYIMAVPGYERKVRLYDHLIKVISERDYWERLIQYLKGTHRDSLVDVLLKGLVVSSAASLSSEYGSVLETFASHLAKYYMSPSFATIPAIWRDPKHINEVWVPLQLDDITKTLNKRGPLEQIEMLNYLYNSNVANVAVIKGDPGMGKSTLVKKIAYDWAEKYSRNRVADNNFSLVLAVPLRSVGKCNSFVELALHYFVDILKFPDIIDMSEPDKSDLIKTVKKLGDKLLICFDGLDEYGSYGESPLRNLFAPPFSRSTLNSKLPPPILPHKLIITSRPYACQTTNKDFLPLKFEICLIDDKHLADFIRIYCETPQGVQKVTDYLQTQRELVIKVPLILIFVCYLADLKEEIPANLTLLYDSLTMHMLKRENLEAKLEEKVDVQKWKESRLVKATGRLAFEGFTAIINRKMKEEKLSKRQIITEESGNELEFDDECRNKCEVTDDSFVCGFLLHKYDYEEECLKTEFLHFSIQEFFAALHCYQLMLQGWNTDRYVIVRKILEEDSQFGRFLFGISSKEKKFGEMVKWLNVSIGDVLKDDDLERFFSTVSVSLSDTLKEEQLKFGQHLSGPALDALETKIFETKTHGLFRSFTPNVESTAFAEGLNLTVIDEDWDQKFWYIASLKKPRFAKLVVVTVSSIEKLVRKFDQIQILVLVGEPMSHDWASLFKSLPPVASLWIEIEEEPEFAVSFRLQSTGTSTGIKMKKFKFGWSTSDADWATRLLYTFDTVFLTVKEIIPYPVNWNESEESDSDEDTSEDEMIENMVKSGWFGLMVNVSVNKNVPQEDLIASLIKLAMSIRDGKTAIDTVKCSVNQLLKMAVNYVTT